MLNLILTLVIGIVVLILFKIGYICYKYLRFCRLLRKLPVTTVPGYWLIGNIKDSKSYIDLILKETNERNRKIILLWFGPFPSISVTNPDIFKQLSKQVSLKARGSMDGYRFLEPWLGEGLLISGGKKWERSRKLLTPEFHFNILNGYVNVMNNVADSLMKTFTDAAKKGEAVDIFPHVCRASLDTMLRCSLSYEEDMQSTTNLSLLSGTMFNLSSLGREFYKLCDQAHKFTGDIIESRRKELDKQQNDMTEKRRLDFLDILLTARDEHELGLTAQEIQDEVDTFTFEGHDTTSSVISWTIFALAKHPVLQEKVFSEVRSIMGGKDSLSPFEIQVDPENEPVLLPDIIMRSQNGVHVKLIERKH